MMTDPPTGRTVERPWLGWYRRHAAPRLNALLLVASLVVPAVHFAVVAFTNRADVHREGRDTIIRTAAIMREHARKVFETQEMALARVEDRIRDLSWAEIAAPATSAFLDRLQARRSPPS